MVSTPLTIKNQSIELSLNQKNFFFLSFSNIMNNKRVLKFPKSNTTQTKKKKWLFSKLTQMTKWSRATTKSLLFPLGLFSPSPNPSVSLSPPLSFSHNPLNFSSHSYVSVGVGMGLIFYIQLARGTTSFHLRFICFAGKPSIKIVFHIFQCLVTKKKLLNEKLSLVNGKP